jgi:hypothetical protein
MMLVCGCIDQCKGHSDAEEPKAERRNSTIVRRGEPIIMDSGVTMGPEMIDPEARQ